MRKLKAKHQYVGNIASLVVQERFKHDFGVDGETQKQYADTKGWIVSIATAGAVFGCLGVRMLPTCSLTSV